MVASTVSSTPCPRPRLIVNLAILPSIPITTSTITSPLEPAGSCDRSGFGEGCTTTSASVVSPSPSESMPDAASALAGAAVAAADITGCSGAGVGTLAEGTVFRAGVFLVCIFAAGALNPGEYVSDSRCPLVSAGRSTGVSCGDRTYSSAPSTHRWTATDAAVHRRNAAETLTSGPPISRADLSTLASIQLLKQ